MPSSYCSVLHLLVLSLLVACSKCFTSGSVPADTPFSDLRRMAGTDNVSGDDPLHHLPPGLTGETYVNAADDNYEDESDEVCC